MFRLLSHAGPVWASVPSTARRKGNAALPERGVRGVRICWYYIEDNSIMGMSVRARQVTQRLLWRNQTRSR